MRDLQVKLFFVQGIRHHAVVMASDQKEAVELAEKAHGADDDKIDPRVLYGSVRDWEVPEAIRVESSEGIPDRRRVAAKIVFSRRSGARVFSIRKISTIVTTQSH